MIVFKGVHEAIFSGGTMMLLAATLLGVSNVSPALAQTISTPDLIGERYPVTGGPSGPRCRFRKIQNLHLEDNRAPVVKSAHYRVSPREGIGQHNVFVVVIERWSKSFNPEFFLNWRGVWPRANFSIDSPKHKAGKIAAAVLLADGRKTEVRLSVQHDRLDAGFDSIVGVSAPLSGAQIIKALDGARTATVLLYGNNDELVSRWTYDVAAMKDIPDALAAANWQCS